jgi:hypothetical protein
MGMGMGGILYPSTIRVWVWYCSTLPIPYPLPSLINDLYQKNYYIKEGIGAQIMEINQVA